MLEVCLLGCGGSLPVPYRNLTSLLVNYKGKKILIDCGEGTQVSMKILGCGFKSIDIICFTHSHADHIMGLPGLLLTIANAERTDPLTIIAPSGFLRILKGLMVVCPYLPFEIKLIEVSENKSFTFENIVISSLPVDHTIPCNAYSLEIKRNRKFNVDKAKLNLVPMALWSRLQNGEIINYEDRIYTPDMVLGESRKGLKLSYCTDTRPTNGLKTFIRESNLFICEGMYGDEAEYDKAVRNKHMLFSEAANLAKEADVSELWLTHFSPSMLDPYKYINTTKKIFANTVIGEDRMFKTLAFKTTEEVYSK